VCDLGGAGASVAEGQAHLGRESLVDRDVVVRQLVVSQCSLDQRTGVIVVDPLLRELVDEYVASSSWIVNTSERQAGYRPAFPGPPQGGLGNAHVLNGPAS
jgi:hypothetical protein